MTATRSAGTAKTKRPAKTAKRATVRKMTSRGKAKTAQTAERAAAKARAQGARGRASKLTKYQTALRDTAIMARVHEGRTRKRVAEEFGISVRAVEAIVADFRASPSSLDDAPMQIVERLARTYLRQVGDLQAMAAEHAERNPNVALGATKAAGDALLRYTELMSAVGKLPDNLELFRAESVLRQIADEMMDTMERVEAGELSAADAGAVFRRIVSEGERVQIPEVA